MTPSTNTTWWYASGAERLGPVPHATLHSLIGAGVVTRDTLVWAEGMAQWQAAHAVPAWAQQFVVAPPPLPPEPPPLPAQAPPLPPPLSQPPVLPASASDPTPTPASTPWAPYPRRVAAALIDLLLVVLVAVLPPGLVWSDAAVWVDHGAAQRQPLAIVLSAFATLAFLLYHALMLSRPGEATLGKRLLGLRVTDETGARLGFWHAFGRTCAQTYSAVLLGIGLLMPLWTKRHQALHDKLAGTLVVRAAHAGWPLAASRGPALRPWQVAALALALPLSFAFDLRDAVDSGSQQRMAQQLYQTAQTTARKVAQEFETTGQVTELKPEASAGVAVEVEAHTGIVTTIDTRTGMKVQLTPSGQRSPLVWACRLTHESILSPPGDCVMSFR